jgi:hypothetical protein
MFKSARFAKFLVPGNHDRFQNNAGFPGGAEFDAVFGQYWTSGLRGVSARKYPDQGATDELILIGADFCFRRLSLSPQGPWRFAGQGIVADDVLDKLRTKTTDLAAKFPSAAIVWVVHFPPVPKKKLLKKERKLRLREAERLTALAKEVGRVKLIIAGHLHRNLCSYAVDDIKIWCAGSASSMDYLSYHFIHEINISVDSGKAAAVRSSFRWDPSARSFIPAPGLTATHSW